MYYQGKSINGSTVQEEDHLDEITLPIAAILIAVFPNASQSVFVFSSNKKSTDSKLANPELRLLRSLKKFVTISLKGSVQVRIVRAEESGPEPESR